MDFSIKVQKGEHLKTFFYERYNIESTMYIGCSLEFAIVIAPGKRLPFTFINYILEIHDVTSS